MILKTTSLLTHFSIVLVSKLINFVKFYMTQILMSVIPALSVNFTELSLVISKLCIIDTVCNSEQHDCFHKRTNNFLVDFNTVEFTLNTKLLQKSITEICLVSEKLKQ